MTIPEVEFDLEHLAADGNLAYDHDRADRWELQGLEEVPDGGVILVRVGKRMSLGHDAIAALHRHHERLTIRLNTRSAHVARLWYDAIETGEIW